MLLVVAGYLESLLNHSLLGRQVIREQWKAPTSGKHHYSKLSFYNGQKIRGDITRHIMPCIVNADRLASTNLYESAESDEDEDGFWSRLYKNNGAS